MAIHWLINQNFIVECQPCLNANRTDWATDLKQFVDIEVSLLSHRSGLSKSQRENIRSQRDEKREEIIKKASALRNSCGGVLFIHIKGLHIRFRNLHFFNELVDARLEKLIEDGSLFVNNYQKIWPIQADEAKPFEQAHEFLLLTVKGCSVLSTYDFKTKIASDESVCAPSLPNIFHLIYKCDQGLTERHRKPGGIYLDFEESRSVQLKAFRNNAFVDNITSENLESFVEFVWEKLRFREYLTSLATINGGGSYFLGVEEADTEELSYVTKTSIPIGIRINPDLLDTLRASLLKKINSNILVQSKVTVSDLVEVRFHLVIPFVQNFVLEIAVSHVRGCVFYHKTGPEAFTVMGQALIPIPFTKWLKKLRQLKL